METFQGKLAAKAKNGHGFKVEGNDNWFNAVDNVVPYLAKIEVGTVVEVNYTKKGIKQSATKIVAVSSSKDTTEETPKKSWKSNYQSNKKSDSYNNPERTAQIQRGNALNAAAYLLSGQQGDPETLSEMCIVSAEMLLNWLRAE